MDFYVMISGRKEGPYSEVDIRKRILAGELTAHALCWTEGWTDRRRLVDTFPDAFNTLARQTPTPEPPLRPVSRRRPTPRSGSDPARRLALVAIAVSAAVLLVGALILR